ncbi:MAG TPA: hypothetical protein VII47_14890 [Actinomycetota bacterium]|jgi:hypothetical protein
MAPDKPHPLGLSPEAGNAVTNLLKEQREAEARAKAPKDNKPEDVKTVVARIVEDYSQGTPRSAPEPEKKSLRRLFRRG